MRQVTNQGLFSIRQEIDQGLLPRMILDERQVIEQELLVRIILVETSINQESLPRITSDETRD
jgi:hypothetical protein